MENKWNRRFFNIANEVSKWSKDPSTKIGAVIVGEKGQIVSQGYNGFPRGIEDTYERYHNRQEKYKFCIHAEANAIFNAIHNNSDTNGCSMYVVGLPVCHECAKAIIQCGLNNVFVSMISSEPNPRWKESCDLAALMFDESQVNYFKIQSKQRK